jgi:predicted secreted protein
MPHFLEEAKDMFDDNRGRRIVLLAHCILNQNSISDGTADFPGQFTAVVEELIRARVGIVQLPCPELTCLGLDRQDPGGGARPLLEENTRIREALGQESRVDLLRAKAREVVGQVLEYRKHGFQVAGLIGVDRSPSCGIGATTAGNQEVRGSGVFMEILLTELAASGVALPAAGTRTSRVEESVLNVRRLLERA